MSTTYRRTIRISRLIGLFLIAALLWSGPALAAKDAPPQAATTCTTASDACWESGFHVPGVEGTVQAMVQAANGDIYVGGKIVSAGGISVNSLAMWDGTTWHDVGGGVTHTTSSSQQVYALALDTDGNLYVGGVFDHAGSIAAGGLAKWNGTTWEAVGGGTNGSVTVIKATSGGLTIGGTFTQVGTTAANHIAYRDFGSASWVTLGSGVDDTVYAIELEPGSDNLFVGGAFAVAGGHAAYGIARYDGVTWGAVGGGLLNTGGTVYSLLGVAQEEGGYYLYVGGAFSQVGTTVEAHNIARWDGSAWTAIDYGTGGEVRAIAMSSAGVLYVGGDFSWVGEFHELANNIAAMTIYEGWTELGDGVGTESYEEVNALLLSGSELIVGGAFELADSRVVNNLAKWVGSSATWSSLDGGAGVDGAVDVLLGSSSTSTVYAAGSITHFGSLQGVGLAHLYESTWMEMGNPAAFYIRALAKSRLISLYAGGAFTSIGGVDANHLARWNGAVWIEVAGGTNGPVNALAPNPDRTLLYVGGEFSEVGTGISASHIAAVDERGMTWQILGEGLDGDVRALALDANGNLYAGGEFSYAGDLYVNHIAMWDGSAWHALGTGLSGSSYIEALTFDADGRLYAGGYFSHAGGTLVNGVAMWNGYAWSALGSGMDDGVGALAVDSNGYLYAGGDFDTAGGVTVNHIARWDGFAWSALGSGTDSNVFALAIPTADRLIVGGAFKTAGAKPSSYIGAYTFPAPSTAPVPSYPRLTPDSATEGFAAFWLTADGSDFSSRSVVRWNGSALTTTYVSGSQLKAFVPAALIARHGSSGITVYTPAPVGGGESFPLVGFKIMRAKCVYLPAVLRLVE